MFEECIRIHSTRPDGSVMRPKGDNPNEHWSHMLVGPYLAHGGVAVSHPQDEKYPVVDITPEFQRTCQHGFLAIMRFIQSNQLAVTINRDKCAACSGAPGCVSTLCE